MHSINVLNHALQLPPLLDTIAIIVGAMTGAMLATRKGFDWLGVLIVAFCTGVGGGLIRDILLQNGVPVLLVTPAYQLYAVMGAIIGMFFARGAARFTPAYEALDTFMIGIWVLLGCTKAQAQGLDAVPVVFIGTIAAVGGGLARDILCHDVPVMFKPGYWYTIAAFWAACTFTMLQTLGAPIVVAQIAAVATASGLHLLSLRYELTTPTPFDVNVVTMQYLRRWRKRMSERFARKRKVAAPPSFSDFG